MRSLLEELYYGSYERKLVQTPAYKAASDAMAKTWEAAREKLSRQELDELWSTAVAVLDLEGCAAFGDGFRLGVSLMLEALAPAK